MSSVEVYHDQRAVRWSRWTAKDVEETYMDITTLLIIVLVLVLLGGGFYGRGRWY